MDLILLQPGNTSIIGSAGTSTNGFQTGGSLIDSSFTDINPLVSPGQSIELVSIHQGIKNQPAIDVSAMDHTKHRPLITEFTCVKYVDKTSVSFYDYCLRAEPIGKGIDQPTKIFIARNSGDKTVNILTIELRDAIITEIQLQSHPDDMPTEQFTLNFTEILWTYHINGADGSANQIKTGWSLLHNRSIDTFTNK